MLLPKFRAFDSPFLCKADIAEYEASVDASNVTVTTTAETVIISSAKISVPRDNCRVVVRAGCQITTSANSTTCKPRIRRGTTTGGTLCNEANAETIKVTAGGTEPFSAIALDTRAGVGEVQYCFTLEFAGADATGTALQAWIEVLVLEG